MGITRLENVFRCRSLLDLPRTNSPSFHQMFQEEISVEQDVLSATTNAQRPWATKTYQLNYTYGQDFYPINCTDFGKPLLVTKVIYSPYINRVNVPFSDLNGQLYGTVLSGINNTYGIPWDIEETPERFSFYREGVLDSQVRVGIQPQPQWSGTYEIIYAPSYIGDNDPLEACIQLPEMGELVRLRCAVGLLAYCKWSDDDVADMAKKQELRQTFEYKLGIKEPIFQRYISSITTPKSLYVSDWNSAY